MVFLKKMTFSNILYAAFLLLILIPSSRKFIQLGVQSFLSKIVPANINVNEAISIDPSYVLNLKGINTDDLVLSDNNNKVIVINFWATWCPPCVAEMPAFQKLYDNYKQDVTFAFVSNEKAITINSFLKENKYTLPIYSAQSQLPSELEYSSFPTTFIIDKKGDIVLHKTGVANWAGEDFLANLNMLIKE